MLRRRRQPRFDLLESRRLLTAPVAEFPLQSPGGATEGIAASQTAVWVTEQNNALASINPTTLAATQFNIPTPNSGPTAITLGPDGSSMWFLEKTANQIGEINIATGAITEYPVPNPAHTEIELEGITAGPANEVWFTEAYPNKIGMINTQTGAISQYSLPGGNLGGPEGITYGPDGNLWIADTGEGQIVSFNPGTQAANAYAMSPASYASGNEIMVGPDKNIWFTDPLDGVIGHFNLKTHQFAARIQISGAASLAGITTGSDGNIWVTGDHGGYAAVGVYNVSTGKSSSYVVDALFAKFECDLRRARN